MGGSLFGGAQTVPTTQQTAQTINQNQQQQQQQQFQTAQTNTQAQTTAANPLAQGVGFQLAAPGGLLNNLANYSSWTGPDQVGWDKIMGYSNALDPVAQQSPYWMQQGAG